MRLVLVEALDDLVGEAEVVEELLQDHVVVDDAIVLLVVPVRIHRVVHRRYVVQVPAVRVERLIVLVEAAQHLAHVPLRRVAHLRGNVLPGVLLLLLVVLLDHADAHRDLLEAHVQVDQLVQVLIIEKDEKRERESGKGVNSSLNEMTV